MKGTHIALIPVVVLLVARAVPAAPLKIELTLVDDQAIGYATFQSHNQKVLANEGGIFMTHIRTRNEPYTAQQWRLSHSTDGGRTFTTIFEDTHATNPPVIERDGAGNVYLVRPDVTDNHSYLYLFSAAGDYRGEPRVTQIPGSASGKYARKYALGGCRAVTPDGFVIGSFTATGWSPAESVSNSKEYFLKVPAAGP